MNFRRSCNDSRGVSRAMHQAEIQLPTKLRVISACSIVTLNTISDVSDRVPQKASRGTDP